MVKFRFVSIEIDCGDKTCGECKYLKNYSQSNKECMLFQQVIKTYEEKDRIFAGMYARCADCFLAEIQALQKNT